MMFLNNLKKKNFYQSITRFVLWVSLISCLVFIGSGGVVAQEEDSLSVQITGVISDTFPQITTFLTVLNENGLPVIGLTESDIQIFEDEQMVDVADIRVDGDTTQPLEVVLALDLTLDREGDIDFIKEAAIAFVDTLKSQDRLVLITFHNGVDVNFEGFVEDKAALKQLIQDLEQQRGGTAFYEATLEAISSLRSNNDPFLKIRQAVVILTNIGNNIESQAAEAAQESIRDSEVPIHIVAFSNRANVSELKDLALQTRGQIFNLNSADTLATTLQQLSVLLKQGYKVTYRSHFQASDEKQVVTLQVRSPSDEVGEAQLSFVAAGGEGTDATQGEAIVIGEGEFKVTLMGLQPGQVLTDSLHLTTEVTAPTEVVAVTYWLDGEAIITLTTPPYEYHWSSQGAEPGPHIFMSKAIDLVGNEGQSDLIGFSVAEPIAVEASTTVVNLGDSIPFQVKFDEATSVELLLDDEVLHRVENPESPYTFHFDKANPLYPKETGVHVVTILLEDGVGQVAKNSYIITFKPAPVVRNTQERNWLLVWISFIALDVSIIYLLGMLFRKRQSGKRRIEVCRLNIKNLGNIPSAYQLSASAMDSTYNLDLKLEGKMVLSEFPYFNANGASQGASVAATSGGGSPSFFGNGASKVGALSDQADQAKAQAGKAKEAAAKGKELAGKASNAASFASTFLNTLSAIPVIGRPFKSLAMTARSAEAQAHAAAVAPEMATRSAKKLGTMTASAVGAGKDAQKAASGVDTKALGDVSGAFESDPQMGGDVEGTHVTDQATQDTTPSVIHTYGSQWSKNPILETPSLDLGQTLRINLLVRPVKLPGRTHSHKVLVDSRPIGDVDREKRIWQRKKEAEVEISAVSWFYRYFPVLGFILLALLGIFHFLWLYYQIVFG